jgi:hypothetical protein
MHNIIIDRRLFLISTLAVGAASVAPNIQLAVADELSDWLTTSFTAEKELLSPKTTGQLPINQAQRLGRFSGFLIKSWGLETYVEPSVEDITEIFAVKSGEIPSYLTEYDVADETFERARISLASEDGAFNLLAFGVIADPQPLFSRVGRFRRFIFAETARYLIASGGFRRFQPAPGNPPARNYQGYIAGPFTNPDYLPYRGLET